MSTKKPAVANEFVASLKPTISPEYVKYITFIQFEAELTIRPLAEITMRVYLHPLLFAITLSLAACLNTPTDNKGKAVKSVKPKSKVTAEASKEFIHKVYSIAPDLDSTALKVSGGCDCCASDMVFLSENRLLTV